MEPSAIARPGYPASERTTMMANTILNHTVQELIHESANSLVYRALQQPDKTRRILKVLKPDYPTPEERTRYQQEYDIMKTLDVPGVARVFWFEKHQNSLVMCVEDFGGESLPRLWASRRFGFEEALTVSSATSEILGQIHERRIIHKDINPS